MTDDEPEWLSDFRDPDSVGMDYLRWRDANGVVWTSPGTEEDSMPIEEEP